MPNLELVRKNDLASYRRIALGTWRTAYDPTVYGTITLRMDKALEYIEAYRLTTGRRLTVTHLVTKAAAECLKRCPEANAILRFNKIYLRKQVTISVLVVQPDEELGKVDLTTAKIEDADRKTLTQIVDEMDATIEKVRARKDKDLEKSKGLIRLIPLGLIHRFLRMLGFLLYALNLDLRWLGLPRDPFGAIIITNIGSIGLDTAYVPLAPYTHVPIFIAPGMVKEEPVVEGDKVVPGKVMNISASFDHRFIDGYHASVLVKTMREMMENPFASFDDLSQLEMVDRPAKASA
jgi:pyruvate/2-oxoglutarate dehydrogenase complex dihydrolipoamide acyltransferase (E2) component